jgi:hypothetical protein
MGNYNWVPNGIDLSVQPGVGGMYTYVSPIGGSVSNSSASELHAPPIQGTCADSSFDCLNLPDNLDSGDDYSPQDDDTGGARLLLVAAKRGKVNDWSRIGGPTSIYGSCAYNCSGVSGNGGTLLSLSSIQRACPPARSTCPAAVQVTFTPWIDFFGEEIGKTEIVPNSCVYSTIQ